VKVNNVTAKFDIVGPSSICKGDTVFYSLVPGNGVVSYYADHGGIGKLVSKTKIMVCIDKNMLVSSFGIQVTYYSECGEEATAFKVITVSNLQVTAPTVTSSGNILHSNALSGNQWYNQNGIINGATSQNYTAVANGDYYVIQTIGGCNSEPSNVIHIVATGSKEIKKNRAVKVYPNPVTNELVIEIEGNQDEQNFEVVNLNGQTVFKGCIFDKTVVQMSNFSSGVYLVRFDDGETIEVKKIVKE